MLGLSVYNGYRSPPAVHKMSSKAGICVSPIGASLSCGHGMMEHERQSTLAE